MQRQCYVIFYFARFKKVTSTFNAKVRENYVMRTTLNRAPLFTHADTAPLTQNKKKRPFMLRADTNSKQWRVEGFNPSLLCGPTTRWNWTIKLENTGRKSLRIPAYSMVANMVVGEEFPHQPKKTPPKHN